MTRGVEDAMLVLQAISGPDAGDVSSVPSQLDFDATAPCEGLRVGYFPKWMKEAPATDVDRAALETVRKLGMSPVEVSLPDWPYGFARCSILFAEAAAAFEELTLSGGRPTQGAGSRRVAEPLPPVALPLRRRLRAGRSPAPQSRAGDGAHLFAGRLLLVPSLRDEMLTITNFTGHPSLTLRAGFVEVARGAQRLGARPRASAAQVLAAAARAARRHADRPSVR